MTTRKLKKVAYSVVVMTIVAGMAVTFTTSCNKASRSSWSTHSSSE
jgi:hypothetical protein